MKQRIRQFIRAGSSYGNVELIDPHNYSRQNWPKELMQSISKRCIEHSNKIRERSWPRELRDNVFRRCKRYNFFTICDPKKLIQGCVIKEAQKH